MNRPLVRRCTMITAAAAVLLAAACTADADPSVFVQPTTTVSASPTPEPFTGWSDPARSGQPYGETVEGLLTFRGNPMRNYYGQGPVPRTVPSEQWRFPRSGGMCGKSKDAKGVRTWCGTGWTGQPAVFEREGRTWVVFGAYDYKIHFLDAVTGERILPDFPTGDIIKGSVTIDPDGYPLVYSGSRDNYLRVIAFDRDKPAELWKLHANEVRPTLWNDDWDSSPLVIDDYLFEGGENSQFHIVKLNRGYDASGKVTVDPELVFNAPGWDDQLMRDVRDNNVSIEGSVNITGNTVYFSNSGGLVQGWDISGLKDGQTPQRVFRFWTGDDTDSTMVTDETGALYAGVEYERGTARSKEVGQMIKFDPSRSGDPLIWGVADRERRDPGGVYGTPALYQDLAIFGTDTGDVFGIDRETGTVRWKFRLQRVHASPVVVDGVLLVGDCTGNFYAYDISNTQADPQPLWSLKVGGCIESTPAVWKGTIYFGTRAGAFHALGLS